MSQLCRLCLTEGNEAIDFYEYREGLPVSVLTMIILPIKIHDSEDFTMPQKICSNCLEIILSAYKLRDLSLNSERYLKSNINEFPLNIKSEVMDHDEIFIETNEVKEERPRRYSTKENKTKKSRRNSTKAQFNCEQCGKCFNTENEFENHVNVEHNGDGSQGVEDEFSEDYHIDCYKRDKTPKTSLVWRYFGNLLDENDQQAGHTGFHYCALCFNRKTLTKYRTTTATSTLLFHLQNVHGIGRNEDGTETVTNKIKENYYQRKKKERALVVGPASATICSVCGKSFSSHHILNKHMRIHSGIFYSCDR